MFPDGELHEVGSVVSAIQRSGFEARHLEGLREHYALTLRSWVGEPRALVGPGGGRGRRSPGARIWRLYMAGAALNFEAGRTRIHQVLAVRPASGRSGMALRPSW